MSTMADRLADAKRYLCVTEPEYFDRLSAASRHTLRFDR